MCALPNPITAAVVSPLLPEPPVTGGEKRTLRLLEAMERAGLRPPGTSPGARHPGAVAALRESGGGGDVVGESSHGVGARARQHVARLPSPMLHELAGRF